MMTSFTKAFNLNDEVEVVLTDFGHWVWHEYAKKNYGADYLSKFARSKHNVPDSNGRNKFQMWDLMNIFSGSMHLGALEVPFEKNEMFFRDK